MSGSGNNTTGADTAAGEDTTQATAASETFLGLTPAQIVSLVGMVVGAVVPGGTVIAGLSISALTNLAAGVANEVPAAVAAFQEIKATATSATAPTEEQWASWNAAADQAHADAQAAQDKILAGDGT